MGPTTWSAATGHAYGDVDDPRVYLHGLPARGSAAARTREIIPSCSDSGTIMYGGEMAANACPDLISKTCSLADSVQ